MSRPTAAPRHRLDAEPYTEVPLPANGHIRLDRNEGAYPDPAWTERLIAAGAPLLREYPSAAALAGALARRFGVTPDRVTVTNGADGALDRACRIYLGPGRPLVVAEPTFEMFPRFAALAGAPYIAVPWDEEFPRELLLARCPPQAGIIALVSPNNPTGRVISAGDVARIARAAPDALVLLDHVYADYADTDLTAAALEFPNVAVVRTFSKAWGLAGCRVGYAVAAPAIAAAIAAAGDPYPVAGPSIALALAALELGGDLVGRHVDRVRWERADLLARLDRWGVPCPPSQANFVFPSVGASAPAVQARLAGAGLMVRRFADRPALAGSLRISLPGDEAIYGRLTDALAGAIGRPA
jgi:histidinol-phosphate aminotransferase